MKLGSHNSLTYLPPKHWYMYPFLYMARCQTKDIETQYNLGARYFDFRIRFDDEGKLVIAHGSLVFKGDKDTVLDALTFLNERAVMENQTIYVRFLYELNRVDKSPRAPYNEQDFMKFVMECQDTFTHLTFQRSHRKYDWKPLVPGTIGKHTPNTLDLYSSMTWTVLDDLLPVLYATIMNNRNYRKHKDDPDSTIMLCDFIHNIRK